MSRDSEEVKYNLFLEANLPPVCLSPSSIAREGQAQAVSFTASPVTASQQTCPCSRSSSLSTVGIFSALCSDENSRVVKLSATLHDSGYLNFYRSSGTRFYLVNARGTSGAALADVNGASVDK